MSIYSSWPSASANKLDFNAKQFLTDLAAASLDPNFDGRIKGDGTFNPQFTTPLDPSIFNNVGDARFTLGPVLSAVYAKFRPIIAARNEILAAGGCQIINSYICDEEGLPILKATSNCPTNIKDLNFGPTDVIDTIQDLFTSTLQKHSDNFIKYLQKNYLSQGWTASLETLGSVNIFYVNLSKDGESNVFIKYYSDQAQYISSVLNIPLIESKYTSLTSPNSSDYKDAQSLVASLNVPIPDYSNPDIPIVSNPYTLPNSTIKSLENTLSRPLSSYSFLSDFILKG